MRFTREEIDEAELGMDESEILPLAREMIRIPSLFGHEKEMAEFLHSKLMSWGMSPRFAEVAGYGPNVVVDVGEGNGQKVIFNGHMDTVEVMEGWIHDPFGAALEDGILYGLGALDMKCGLATMMIALKTMAESDLSERVSLSFQAVSGEEKDGSGTRQLIANGEFDGAKAVVVGEGFGGLNVVTHGRRGGSYYDIHIQGKSAHGALPHLGISAVEDGSRIVNALSDMNLAPAIGLRSEDGSPLSESQTVLSIRGGTDSLSVPDRCSIRLVRCTIPGGKVDITDDLTKLISGLGLRSQAQVVFNTDPKDLYRPYMTSSSESLVMASQDAIERVIGSRPQLVCGVSEADDNVIAELTGVPVICMGPGETGELARYHQPEEAISVSQLGSVSKALIRTALGVF